MIPRTALLALAAAVVVNASPCPFGQLAEAGMVNKDEAAKFYKVRSEGASAVEDMMSEAELTRRDAEWAEQETHYNEQRDAGDLLFGGGLLKGQLQPLKGPLKGIALPKPQKVEKVVVPDAAHPFKYPKITDVRGMCPTLNTMANHGYISRDGITSFAEAANACQLTLGFGYDTCTFLSALGLVAGGDLPTGLYSIGGQDDRVPNTIGPALGISKHGVFEVDQSITRQDTYLANQANFHLFRFNRWTDIASKYNKLYNFETANEERQVSFKQSLTHNPQFNAEVKHFAVTLAERVFIPRALTNFSHPHLTDYQNVAPFYMNETFPEPNWFKRGSSYGLDDVGLDVANLYLMGPTPVGHNEGYDNFVGTTSSFDFAHITGSTATCLLYDSLLDLSAGSVSPTLVESFALFQKFLEASVKPFFKKYKCDFQTYGKPGKNAGDSTPGVSTKCSRIINGKYQCSK